MAQRGSLRIGRSRSRRQGTVHPVDEVLPPQRLAVLGLHPGLRRWWFEFRHRAVIAPVGTGAKIPLGIASPERRSDLNHRQAGWREAVKGKEIEIGWLAREGSRPARYLAPTAAELGL